MISVSREKLWVALKGYVVCGKSLVAVQSLYEDGWARVRVGGRKSSRFQVKSGVRQGCPCLLGSSTSLGQNSVRSKEAFLWQCTVIL